MWFILIYFKCILIYGNSKDASLTRPETEWYFAEHSLIKSFLNINTAQNIPKQHFVILYK